MWQKILKITGLLLGVGLLTVTSAMLATIYATWQIQNAIQRSAADMQSQLDPQIANPVSLGFYEATGILESELHDSRVASELFAISHPQSNYFSLTHGWVMMDLQQERREQTHGGLGNRIMSTRYSNRNSQPTVSA